jgi:hypothetical protein
VVIPFVKRNRGRDENVEVGGNQTKSEGNNHVVEKGNVETNCPDTTCRQSGRVQDEVFDHFFVDFFDLKEDDGHGSGIFFRKISKTVFQQ